MVASHGVVEGPQGLGRVGGAVRNTTSCFVWLRCLYAFLAVTRAKPAKRFVPDLLLDPRDFTPWSGQI